MKNKKAISLQEATIGLVVFLLVVGVVFIIYGAVDWTGTIDKESCHNSAIVAAINPIKSLVGTPLRCQTEKICIRGSMFGECDAFKGEKNVKNIQVSNEQDVRKVFSDSWDDCVWMFYFGDKNLFSRDVFSDKILCGLCSRIAFDKSAKEKFDTIGGLGDELVKGGHLDILNREIGNLQIPTVKDEIRIDTKKQYVVVFESIEKNQVSYALPAVGGCVGSLVIAGAVAGIPIVGWIAGPTIGIGIFVAGCLVSSNLASNVDKAIFEKGFVVGFNIREYSSSSLNYCSNIFTIS